VFGSNGGSLQFFNGNIAEIRLYDVPLNEEEIATLFRSRRPNRVLPGGEAVAGPSPLDKLDPEKIAPQDRLDKIPELVAVLKGPKSEIFGVAFSPDSKKVACACNDGELYYWDLGEGKVEAGLPLGPMGGAIAALAFSADGKRLACANQAQARIYDLKPPQPKGIREIPLKVGLFPGIAWSPDGTAVAITDRAVVRLYDWIEGKERQVIRGHHGEVRTVYFSRDGSTMLT